MFGLGADPHDIVRFDDFGEPGIFRKEAVAGMNRIRPGNFGCRDDRGDVEIAVGRRRWANADCVVGQAHMHRLGVGGGMDRNRFDTHFMGSAMDAERDFATVGDQYAGNRHLAPQPYPTTARGWSYSTGWPLSTRIALTVPALVAVIGFITFMASTISSVSPAFTVSPTFTKGAAPGSEER